LLENGLMPTLLVWNGYRFFFYSNEGSEPPHIHVAKAGAQAKIWLHNYSVAYNDELKHNELAKIMVVVRKNSEMFLKAWYEYEKRKH